MWATSKTGQRNCSNPCKLFVGVFRRKLSVFIRILCENWILSSSAFIQSIQISSALLIICFHHCFRDLILAHSFRGVFRHTFAPRGFASRGVPTWAALKTVSFSFSENSRLTQELTCACSHEPGWCVVIEHVEVSTTWIKLEGGSRAESDCQGKKLSHAEHLSSVSFWVDEI